MALLVIVTLLLFGGPTIQPLLLVLLVGVTIGSYSSIFIAGFLLVSWESGELGRFLRRPLPFAGAGRRQPSPR
jgi:preprotein translocase subunit SecF